MAFEFPITELVACIDREAKFRATTYPRWVREHKLTAPTADLERRRLAGVRARLVQSEAINRILPGLFVRAGYDESGTLLLLKEAHEAVSILLPPVPEWLA
jgi:hypothetical protein